MRADTLTRNVIHAMHGAMQKMQVLFPNPLMERLRAVARSDDQPVSEIIRRATEAWLARREVVDGPRKISPAKIPVFRGGKINVSAAAMRDALYTRTE